MSEVLTFSFEEFQLFTIMLMSMILGIEIGRAFSFWKW